MGSKFRLFVAFGGFIFSRLSQATSIAGVTIVYAGVVDIVNGNHESGVAKVMGGLGAILRDECRCEDKKDA